MSIRNLEVFSMIARTQKSDSQSRVVLPAQFANRLVVVELVAHDECRVKLAQAVRKRPSLNALLAAVTEANLPEKVDFGPPVGNESL